MITLRSNKGHPSYLLDGQQAQMKIFEDSHESQDSFLPPEGRAEREEQGCQHHDARHSLQHM